MDNGAGIPYWTGAWARTSRIFQDPSGDRYDAYCPFFQNLGRRHCLDRRDCLGRAVPAVADPPQLLRCGDLACEETKETFNAAEVICFDQDGGVGSVWNCAYELHYVCVERDTREERSGGYIPTIRDVCEHVCGKCPEGWK